MVWASRFKSTASDPGIRASTMQGFFSFEKRMSRRFTLGGSYAYVSEHDDALSSNLGTSALGSSGGTNGFPTDSFRGVPPIVTDPGVTDAKGNVVCPSGTNATGSFTACNGNFVPKAGVFYDGAKLDSGPSDFALRHTFELHGLVELPWKIQFSSLFRAQSGFHYTQSGRVTYRSRRQQQLQWPRPQDRSQRLQRLRLSSIWICASRRHSTSPSASRHRSSLNSLICLTMRIPPLNFNQNHSPLRPGEPIFGTVSAIPPGPSKVKSGCVSRSD